MEICDIYLIKKTMGSTLFTRGRPNVTGVPISPDVEYRGFLGCNIERILGVALIITFRNANIEALNVPVKYRDNKLLSVNEVEVALKKQLTQGSSIQPFTNNSDLWHPMILYYRTDAPEHQIINGEGGGVVAADRLDGHIWSRDEQIEYAYDYNNLL